MGEHPRPPRDGELVWTRDFFATGWEVDEESGVMNFWEKLERRSVAQDEVVARIHPPVPGRPGLNVYGKAIGVAKPQQARLRAGKGVQEATEDGLRVFRATVAGRVRLVSGVLSVDDVYTVKGDVSLETGNIHHTGCVTIGGDIKTGALVEADGDIVVKGMLEPCRIRCGGSLTVAGGIVGDEGYDIEVAGELHARYVSEATVRAGGDVHVVGEIAHSHVETTRPGAGARRPHRRGRHRGLEGHPRGRGRGQRLGQDPAGGRRRPHPVRAGGRRPRTGPQGPGRPPENRSRPSARPAPPAPA